MDPDVLERKRRYKQQIIGAMNDNPERFAGHSRSPLPDMMKWKMKAGGPRAHRKVPHHAIAGAELQWHAPVPIGRYEDENHVLIRLTPENQEAYRHDPRFQNFDQFGRRYATLGAGPSSQLELLLGEAELASFPNQEKDVAPHSAGIAVKHPAGMPADDYIDLLLRLDRAYMDDLAYQIHPGERVLRTRIGPVDLGPSYNSNSYVSGLLAASGVTPPQLQVATPGYDRRVPPRYFGK